LVVEEILAMRLLAMIPAISPGQEPQDLVW
jgi:hypothetical protein